MKKLRRIISMLMVLVLFIGILPMNLGVVKAEAELDETTKLKNIKVRAYNSETEIWDDIGLTIKEYVGSKQDTIYTPIEFDPGRRLYQIKLDSKYKKIQFYIEKAYKEQVVEIESSESYKIRNSNYTEETVLQSGSNTFEFYVKPSNGSATREYFFSVDRGDTTKAYKIYLPIGYKDLKTAFEGDIVNIKASTDFKGKVFEKWIAPNNVEIKDPYIILNKFKMPNSDVTIKTQYRDSSEDGSKLKYIIVHAMKDNVWETFYDSVKVSNDTYDYELNLSGGYTDVYLTLQAEDILLNNSEGSLLKQSNNHIKIKVNGDSLSVDDFPYGFDTSKTVLIEGENLLNIKIISKNFKNTSDYTLKINNGEVKCNVSFNPDYGKGSMEAVEIAKGSTYELPKCTFEAPENKEFAGWKIGEEIKNPGDEITVDKDTEVIALWKDIIYKVSLVPGEGKGETIEKEYAKDSKYTLPDCPFEAPTNKEFKSWSVNNEEKAVGDVITINDNTEITATWRDKTIETHKVILVANNNIDDNIETEKEKGTEYTLPDCSFTAPDGQVFKAWEVAGEEKAVGDKITVNGDTEITATWKDKPNETVTVTLVANNDTDKTIVKEVKKGTEYTLPECDFTAPDGQVFKAWKIGDKEYDPQEKITIDDETEIKAIWKENPDKENPDEDNPSEDNSDEEKPGEKPNQDKLKQKHAINITPSPYGRVIIDSPEAKMGDKVTVRAIAKYGYELVSLSVRDASGKLLPITNGEFIMPDGEVSIYPIFREIAPYIEPEIYDKAEREEQKMRDRRNYYHEEEKDEDDVKTIDKAKEEKQKESKVLITIGSEMLDKVDGGVRTLKAMDTKPYIKGGRTMLPLRYIAEALGYRVAWLSETRTAVIMDIGLRVEIPVDSSFIIVNGVKYTSDVKPDMRNNRIMLPIANIARALGLKDGKDILWDEVNRQVTLIRNFNTK